MTRNVSAIGVYVECDSPVSIPLFRLVQFQLERDACKNERAARHPANGARAERGLPRPPPSGSQRQGLALRLMVDPRRNAVAEPQRATA